MKVYIDNMNEKQLRWAVLEEDLPTHGSKADLKLRLQQYLESVGVAIADYYIESERYERYIKSEQAKKKDQVSQSDLRALMKFMEEFNKLFKHREEEHNKHMAFFKEQIEQRKQIKELLNERAELITELGDSFKQLQKGGRTDQADKGKEIEAEISNKLSKNNEHKEIQITDVSALQKNRAEVSEETECNDDIEQSEVLEKSFELVEEITVQSREDAEEESEDADEESEDAAQGSIFVSVKVTVDSEYAEGNGVISNTNISEGAADEEKVCSEFGDCVMEVAVETDDNERICVDLLPASCEVEISDNELTLTVEKSYTNAVDSEYAEGNEVISNTNISKGAADEEVCGECGNCFMRCSVEADEGEKMYTDLGPVLSDAEKSDDELEDNEHVNYYDDDLEEGDEESDNPGKMHVYHATLDTGKSDDEQRDEDINYNDNNEEGNISRKTHVDHATPDEWCHQHRPMRDQMQMVLMNLTLKLAEWEDDEEQKELNPGQIVLRKKEATSLINQLQIYHASLNSKWWKPFKMEKKLLIRLYKWKIALATKMYSAECIVLLPSPCWSSERAETACSIPDTGWYLLDADCFHAMGTCCCRLLLRLLLLLAMDCFDDMYCIVIICDCK